MTATLEEMAYLTGMLPARGNVLTSGNRDGVTLDALARFAALVRAQARAEALENAARVCESRERAWLDEASAHQRAGNDRIAGALARQAHGNGEAAAAIRALPAKP